ncbi:probable BOI-related E3 ubiquitin-protein ligase 2 [Camellia sinensis]|uniref:probable BOI-related E3 ubiquitin-protein ligase 2 n=1 Tax=Camellia sinensis TaxID=4442 RepID=UPI001035EF57|nr:probable BOI-related E3 ubiquitin-protein ligase 2 [Camellia sinensis]
MALHHQYPSLLFSKGNGQGNLLTNLPLHPHPFATLIHSAMFLNNGVAINSRKRRREVADTELSLAPTNLFSLQPPPPPTPSPQPAPQKMCTPLSLPFLSFTSMLTEDRTAQIVEQSDQIDEIIKTHADQLRRTLADKWQRHYSTLIYAAEERASKRLKERELECELAVRRNAELEQRAAQYSEEAHVWQAKARKLEETAASLRAALRQQANVHGGGGGSRQGCTGCGGGVAEDAESSYVDPDRVEPVSMACKACGKRVATVMMWPCRHVCVCRRCEAVTKVCPVCLSLKTASLEVFLS